MNCTHARNKNKPCQRSLCPIYPEELGHTANVPVEYQTQTFDSSKCQFLKSKAISEEER